MERCPFCGGQLISCDCLYKLLGLIDRSKYDKDTAFLPPDIYANGLTRKQAIRWEAMLNKKGRVPFIEYPIVCAKCGALWPELFMVSNAEWEHYIQINQRRNVLCRKCYDHIKELIDPLEKRRPNKKG